MEDIAAEKQRRSELATSRQREASDPAKSVWVEASAGTGKTKVLSDRVLRILLNGAAPSRILCLTYTKAAAVEMNGRIAGRLSKWAVAEDAQLEKELSALLGREVCDDAELKARARKLFALLLDTPGGMKIQTIHSFCQEILKRFPLEAKISPYFEVMDDREAFEAMQEIKRNLLQKIEQEPDSPTASALAFLTRNVSEYRFSDVLNAIAENRNKIFRLRSKFASLDALWAETAKRLALEPDDTKASLTLNFWQNLPRGELKVLAEAWAHGSATDVKKAQVVAEVLQAEDASAFYSEYRNMFLTLSGEPRSVLLTKGALAYNANALQTAQDEACRLIDFEEKCRAAELFAATKAVWLLAEDMIAGYNLFKKIHSRLDYEDLIVLTRNLLETPGIAEWVLFKLDGGIDNILIDEAQDTSPDQWGIIRAVCADFFSGESAKDTKRTVFAVGDRKQSIYSFQGADPAEFEKMRRYFRQKIAPTDFKEVKLAVSFRSAAAVLDTVNKVFEDAEAKVGVADPEEDITHVPSRIGEGGKIELWPLIEPEEGENPNIYAPPVERIVARSTSSRLAAQIAENIRKMVQGREMLVSQNRPLRYADFMILVQRRNSFVEELVRACKNAAVNVAGVDKIKLSEQIGVQDLLALAQFLLLPTDDLTLACVLKSPLFGLKDEDLFKLCYNRGSQTLWTRLGQEKEYQKVYAELQELLNLADYVRPFELYAYVLNQKEGRKKLVSRLGVEAEDGLDEFVNLTLEFERGHIPSLQGFVEWMKADEVEIKRELEQSDIDAVRIMTVHGSKGLQAPVVILPDTVRVKQIKNETAMLFDDLLYYPLGSQYYEKNCKAIKQREKELSLEEYRRLLYVALTRAEDRLYICGYRKSQQASPESWYDICQRNFALMAQKQDDDKLVYEVAQKIAVAVPDEAPVVEEALPQFSWLKQKAPQEDLLAKPLSPSKLDDVEEAVASPIDATGASPYRRGLVIHKLLQCLPAVNEAEREILLKDYLQKNLPDFTKAEQEKIAAEVLGLLQDERFGAIFGGESKAEVPIMGKINNQVIAGQIDRLAVEKDRVLIVDFKTNRPAAKTAADVPETYVRQLRAYRQLVSEIYPGKKVVSLILWTDTANLMEVI